jgi:hypothetical protein
MGSGGRPCGPRARRRRRRRKTPAFRRRRRHTGTTTGQRRRAWRSAGRHRRTGRSRRGHRRPRRWGRRRSRRPRRRPRTGRRLAVRTTWERRAGSVAPLPRVLLHRLIDEVVDGTLELARHLLERFPQDVSALKGAGAFLVRITHGCALIVPPSRESVKLFPHYEGPGTHFLSPSLLSLSVPSSFFLEGSSSRSLMLGTMQ